MRLLKTIQYWIQVYQSWRLKKKVEETLRATSLKNADFVRLNRLLDIRERVRVSRLAAERKQSPSEVAFYSGQWKLIEEILGDENGRN